MPCRPVPQRRISILSCHQDFARWLSNLYAEEFWVKNGPQSCWPRHFLLHLEISLLSLYSTPWGKMKQLITASCNLVWFKWTRSSKTAFYMRLTQSIIIHRLIEIFLHAERHADPILPGQYVNFPLEQSDRRGFLRESIFIPERTIYCTSDIFLVFQLIVDNRNLAILYQSKRIQYVWN